jgi:hypothetical protein
LFVEETILSGINSIVHDVMTLVDIL